MKNEDFRVVVQADYSRSEVTVGVPLNQLEVSE